MITPEFNQAIHDYSLLLEKQYPRKQVLKLVGDRYLLDKTQRTMLNRGIFLARDVESRQSKRAETIRGRKLHVDTYNVLFSIANYLLGRLVFISNDGFIRDAGETYEKLLTHKKFHDAMVLVTGYLEKEKPSAVHFYIDEPVTESAQVRDQLDKLIGEAKLNGNTILCRKPDHELLILNDGIICSSDSEIMDQTPCMLVDVVYEVLKDNFTMNLVDLAELPENT